MKKIGKIIGAFLRGAVKSFPLGNAIIEGVNNAKGGVVKEVVTEAGETVQGTIKNPHAWVSVITQMAVIGLIIWAVATGRLDIKAALELLNPD